MKGRATAMTMRITTALTLLMMFAGGCGMDGEDEDLLDEESAETEGEDEAGGGEEEEEPAEAPPEPEEQAEAPPEEDPTKIDEGPARPCGLVLAPNEAMYPGQVVKSCSGNHTVSLQTDGNVVVRNSILPLWSTVTGPLGPQPGPDRPYKDGHYGGVGNVLVMQGDGNLVLLNSTVPTFNTATYGFYGVALYLQDDGNLVIRNSQGVPVWSWMTGGYR
jgi:hypothetical protein